MKEIVMGFKEDVKNILKQDISEKEMFSKIAFVLNLYLMEEKVKQNDEKLRKEFGGILGIVKEMTIL